MRVYKVSSQVVPPVGQEMKVFRGEVRSNRVFEPPEAELMKVLEIAFRDGGRTVWHLHKSDQVLYVTTGRGFVEDNTEHLELYTGDLVIVPKETRHRHGAYPGSDMTHLSFMTVGETTMEDD
jgi:quercetin dioxygenase-like cupin family protein